MIPRKVTLVKAPTGSVTSTLHRKQARKGTLCSVSVSLFDSGGEWERQVVKADPWIVSGLTSGLLCLSALRCIHLRRLGGRRFSDPWDGYYERPYRSWTMEASS